uniref:Mannan endo-1 4-beta-mannosidase 6 n=1 Tax=Rhizophora mucronata TaxID=61149 RepID=A0A2P2JNQ1_RHIMU
MDPQWREKKLYPLLGTILLLSFLYLNFNGSNITFPNLLWQPKMGFVATNSTHFVIHDGGDVGGGHDQGESTVYVNGWNSYWLMQESVWSPSRSKVSEMLKRGAQMGLTVCRTWAFSDGHGPNALQLSPGVFNERVFRVSRLISVFRLKF